MRRHAFALAVLVLLHGCAPGPSVPPPVAPAPPDAAASASAPAPESLRPRPTFAAASTITGAGLGPARVGMTLADGVAARLIVAPQTLDCVELRTDAFLRAFPGVATEWTDAGLRSVVVGSKDYATQAGVRAGDTRAQLERAYGDRLRLVPRDLAHFENLGGRGGPLTERFGSAIPAVDDGAGVLLFPLFEGRVDHIEVVPASAGRLRTYAGQCP